MSIFIDQIATNLICIKMLIFNEQILMTEFNYLAADLMAWTAI